MAVAHEVAGGGWKEVKREGDQDHIRWHVVWKVEAQDRGESLEYLVEAVSQGSPDGKHHCRESPARGRNGHLHSRWWRRGTGRGADSRADTFALQEDAHAGP